MSNLAWKGPDFDLAALSREVLEALQEVHGRRALEDLAKVRPHQGIPEAIKALSSDEDAMAGLVDAPVHSAVVDLLNGLGKMQRAIYDLEVADEAVQQARRQLGLRQ